MYGYIAGDDLFEGGEYAGMIPEEDLAELSVVALNNLLATGREMINAYCKKSFSGDIPYIVKLVNVQLLTAMLSDPSKDSESIEGYTYHNSQGAFEAILCRLDILEIDGRTISEKKKSIRARVI